MTLPDPTQIGCGGWTPLKAESERKALCPSDTPETDANEYGGSTFRNAPDTVRLVHADLARKLKIERDELQRTNEALKLTFDLRWEADQRAIQRWQAANPGNDLTWPDHADMVVWLMDQLSSEKAIAVAPPTQDSNEETK